ncbi:HhoA/HhoB/HtrA family serine endopeptidase [Umezakia ovalisporum]|jgi:S1-C subfamily serine protease|uniref:Trypsin-like peptidase domain-containing protein n=2 Tax=Umezakia ovalisporum TaxID=75695 RepID=A0AA43GZ94_9CYAN|nr:HhoA/HhoB/HtrA family serine endopeptidase [Umezakia ovalisporum]MDH6055399.1 trypsin-like peptidase domain-containing protein [Umezakia ovalisporum FSS-43]MDH6064120.1 trypsin-like peptidase domain-containing protein [Umezakia ovalisporum FSS-62]MDH6066334.1 trypsin-like peptidase domain-containing protein [Umezakia ovalisporum APH033B]MDH6071058.1 trypsin-like peptidase domain-containing protein [Umezakia ovalisporum CobakiLakeA]MDH6075988.1 trypsin-like peptidase domain-containing protei
MKRLLKQPALCLILLMTGCISGRDVRNAEQPIVRSVLAKSNTNSEINYITRVVQEVGPAVVRIDSKRTVSISPDPVLERFFQGELPTREEVQQGLGSGFITTADGLIFTNAHVVADADSVTVLLKDGRRFQGDVVGVDTVTDVAVVKIEASQLPTVQLGNSDNLIAGQAAIAIGNPLGLDNTVTQGIISATQRSVAGLGVPTERVDFIQTDAAINPGNSGGPLLNAQGEVVGMNTAIIQGAQGLGFAIPINTAERIAEQLIEKGRVDHPYIGIQMAQLNPELSEKINQSDTDIKVTQDRGVIVLGVVRNSPAYRSGIRPGDIIESINNVAIKDIKEVQQQVENTNIGDTMEIIINRDGTRQKVRVKPEALPTK